MSEKELDKLIEAIEKVAAEHTGNKEKAQQFLQDAGILTQSGELAEPYR